MFSSSPSSVFYLGSDSGPDMSKFSATSISCVYLPSDRASPLPAQQANMFHFQKQQQQQQQHPQAHDQPTHFAAHEVEFSAEWEPSSTDESDWEPMLDMMNESCRAIWQDASSPAVSVSCVAIPIPDTDSDSDSANSDLDSPVYRGTGMPISRCRALSMSRALYAQRLHDRSGGALVDLPDLVCNAPSPSRLAARTSIARTLQAAAWTGISGPRAAHVPSPVAVSLRCATPVITVSPPEPTPLSVPAPATLTVDVAVDAPTFITPTIRPTYDDMFPCVGCPESCSPSALDLDLDLDTSMNMNMNMNMNMDTPTIAPVQIDSCDKSGSGSVSAWAHDCHLDFDVNDDSDASESESDMEMDSVTRLNSSHTSVQTSPLSRGHSCHSPGDSNMQWSGESDQDTDSEHEQDDQWSLALALAPALAPAPAPAPAPFHLEPLHPSADLHSLKVNIHAQQQPHKTSRPLTPFVCPTRELPSASTWITQRKIRTAAASASRLLFSPAPTPVDLPHASAVLPAIMCPRIQSSANTAAMQSPAVKPVAQFASSHDPLMYGTAHTLPKLETTCAYNIARHAKSTKPSRFMLPAITPFETHPSSSSSLSSSSSSGCFPHAVSGILGLLQQQRHDSAHSPSHLDEVKTYSQDCMWHHPDISTVTSH